MFVYKSTKVFTLTGNWSHVDFIRDDRVWNYCRSDSPRLKELRSV